MSETKVKRKNSQNQIIESQSPIQMVSGLIKTGSEIELANLEKILEIQERYDAIQAKKAYTEAMSEFKKNPPKIMKDKGVSFQTQKGTTSYKHATLSNVTQCIGEALSEHGLTASWVTEQNNGSITVTCKITHVMGHSETTSLTAQPDNSGNKNPIQAIGSTVTYLERYTLLALTGLATYDQDDDGGKPEQPAPVEKSMELVEQAFSRFHDKHKDLLAEGFIYDKDKFIKAIYKHFGGLPTNKSSIEKILKQVKPEEAIVELAKVRDGAQSNLYN